VEIIVDRIGSAFGVMWVEEKTNRTLGGFTRHTSTSRSPLVLRYRYRI
jgi:hypothetical protein